MNDYIYTDYLDTLEQSMCTEVQVNSVKLTRQSLQLFPKLMLMLGKVVFSTEVMSGHTCE